MAKIERSRQSQNLSWMSILLVLAVTISSCNPSKRLADGEVFLKKQTIDVDESSDNLHLDEEDLAGILKQKTNRKILLMRFHLWAHNRVDPVKRDLAYQKDALKLMEQIDRREASLEELISEEKGESRKSYRKKRKLKELRKEEPHTWRDWLAETVGEPPVVLDSAKTKKSAEQISILLSKEGYFRNEVDFKVDLSRNEKRAKVEFDIVPGPRFTIRDIKYDVEDPGIARRLDFLKNTSTLKSGSSFSVEVFDDERARIAGYLANRGYYGYTKEYIKFKADSSVGNLMVDITVQFNSKYKTSETNPDSLVVVPHPRYFIGDIVVDTEFDLKDLTRIPSDTLDFLGIKILHNGKLQLDPELVDYTIHFESGDLYQKDRAESTYRRFNNLEIFRSVVIQFRPRANSDVNVLDCFIYLTSAKKQFISTQSHGTHSDGNLGIQADIEYSHRNVFGGAEQGNITLSAGYEAQQALTQTDQDTEGAVGQAAQGLRFNTFEIGPELSLRFNNIFPLSLDRFSRNSNPTSKLSVAFNYQSRPDYTRALTRIRYEGKWIENLQRGRSYFFHFPEISLVKIQKSQSFQDLLDDIDDELLTNSYQDHLITSVYGIGGNWDNKKTKHQRRHHFFHFNIDGSGTALRGVMNAIKADKNVDGHYEIAGIEFAHYTRIDADFRQYWDVDEKNSFATRIAAGVGKTWTNLGALPFEKSFFAGGANSLRAWQARTLGPGSFRDSTALVTYNNIGESRLEANLEYRFNFTPTFEGALFVDAGNIWMLKEDPDRPGTAISSNMLSEVAIGAGLGMRLDFDFFLIRFDFGIQVKDPAKIPGERWIWEPKDNYEDFVDGFYPEGGAPGYFPVINFNLGIGYPF